MNSSWLHVLVCFISFKYIECLAHCGPNEVCISTNDCTTYHFKFKECGFNKVCCPTNRHVGYEKEPKDLYVQKDQYPRPSTFKDHPKPQRYEGDYRGDRDPYNRQPDYRKQSPLSYEAREYLGTYSYSGECGIRKSQHGRVSTGHTVDAGIAHYGEFPWHVGIFIHADRRRTDYGYQNSYKYHCGGVLVDAESVVTAAHCVYGVRRDNLKVKLGEYNLQSSKGEIFPSLDRKVKNIIIHNNYNPSKLVHDIAILLLEKPIRLDKTPHISPACIPPRDFKFEKYSKCFITGYGEDIYKPNYGSNILKVASVTLHDDYRCKELLVSSIRGLSSGFFHKSHRCFTGGYGKDACIGDGGGAVVCPISNDKIPICEGGYGCASEHYFVAGIISWGSENCGVNGSVTVMTDMVEERDWLYNELEDNKDSRYSNKDPYRPDIYNQRSHGYNSRDYYGSDPYKTYSKPIRKFEPTKESRQRVYSKPSKPNHQKQAYKPTVKIIYGV